MGKPKDISTEEDVNLGNSVSNVSVSNLAFVWSSCVKNNIFTIFFLLLICLSDASDIPSQKRHKKHKHKKHKKKKLMHDDSEALVDISSEKKKIKMKKEDERR